MLLSIQALYRKNMNILLTIAVNLRPYCKEKLENNHFGCHISFAPMFYNEISKCSDFWSLAHIYKNNLAAIINDFALIPKEFDINIIEIILRLKARNIEEDHVLDRGFALISNCGILDIPLDYGSVHLKMFNAFASNLLGTFGIILNVSTVQSNMFLSFQYVSPLLSKEQALCLSETFIEVLLKNCDND